MSKISEYLKTIQEEIESRCSNLLGKQIGDKEMHRLSQAARLSAKKLNLKNSYTYDEMVEILGTDVSIEQFKESENLHYRFLVPTVSMSDDALVVDMAIDFVMFHNTVFRSSKPLTDEIPAAGAECDSTSHDAIQATTN